MGQTLISIVAEGKRRRVYIEPSIEHEEIALATTPEWQPETGLPDDPLGIEKFLDR